MYTTWKITFTEKILRVVLRYPLVLISTVNRVVPFPVMFLCKYNTSTKTKMKIIGKTITRGLRTVYVNKDTFNTV